MSPADGARVRRKNRRDALRGVPAGRRSTHLVKTAYGQQQKIRDHHAAWAAARAAWDARGDLEAATA